jgi:hypothetical protein
MRTSAKPSSCSRFLPDALNFSFAERNGDTVNLNFQPETLTLTQAMDLLQKQDAVPVTSGHDSSE